MQGIYGIFGPNGKVYIGQANDVFRRWKEHGYALRDGKANRKLQNAWGKYGKDAFLFLPLEKVPGYADLTSREAFWIQALDAIRTGYNVKPAGDSHLPLGNTNWLGRTHSDKSKALMSASAKARGGRPADSALTKARKSLAALRVAKDPEVQAKRSAAQRAAKGTPEYRAAAKARQNTPEYREKMRAAAMKRWHGSGPPPPPPPQPSRNKEN